MIPCVGWGAARSSERVSVSGEGADRNQALKRACAGVRVNQDQDRTAERDDGAGGLAVAGEVRGEAESEEVLAGGPVVGGHC